MSIQATGIQAMKQALEAIQIASLRCVSEAETCTVLAANAALRATITDAEKQEPVASMTRGTAYPISNDQVFRNLPDGTNLYTAPQPAIPEGWQLVPKKHSPEMRRAFDRLPYVTKQEGWELLLAAAPQPEDKP